MIGAASSPVIATWKEIPDAEYRRHAALSHSEIEVFRQNPELWHGRKQGKIPPAEPSDDFEFGRAFHALMAGQPEHVEIPADVLSANGSRSGQKWKDFAVQNVGKVLLKPRGEKSIATLNGMAAAIDRNRITRAARSSPTGLREISLFFPWSVPGSEMWAPCKSRLDLLTFDKNDNKKPKVIVDWKTSANASPEAFQKSAWDYGYHRQAAWYCQAVAAVWSCPWPEFLFAVIEKTPPYRVEIFKPSLSLIELGRLENEALVADWCERTRDDRWTPDTYGKITELEAPVWAVARLERGE